MEVTSAFNLDKPLAQGALLAIKYARMWYGSDTIGSVTEPVV